ncbi:hypothetical protein [Hydrogenophaga sp.]|nr:hypothetical protein [Hydrogenophaga sp.]
MLAVDFMQAGNNTLGVSMERIAQQPGANETLARRLCCRVREAAGI